jgi:hypothetical protein
MLLLRATRPEPAAPLLESPSTQVRQLSAKTGMSFVLEFLRLATLARDFGSRALMAATPQLSLFERALLVPIVPRASELLIRRMLESGRAISTDPHRRTS